MSATLQLSDFINNKLLFPKAPPVINVDSRQFPVSTYYNKQTDADYIDQALKKCLKIHKKLPYGDVLVFLTGEKEIKEFCIHLKIELGRSSYKSNEEDDSEPEEKIIEEANNKEKPSEFIILPLYSKLSVNEQKKIFNNHSQNTRLFVISTNVAETSLTIPGIKYVVDCGKEKKKVYKKKKNILLIFRFITKIFQFLNMQLHGFLKHQQIKEQVVLVEQVQDTVIDYIHLQSIQMFLKIFQMLKLQQHH